MANIDRKYLQRLGVPAKQADAIRRAALAEDTTGSYAALLHNHNAADITDFTEAAQDVVGGMVAAAGGSYNDAAGTITLPGGGGGGNVLEIAVTQPVASDFTLQNGGTASIADGTYGIIHDSPTATSQIRFVRRNGTVGSTWTMTARMASHRTLISGSYSRCLIARNSTSGRVVIAGIFSNSTQYLVQRWSSYTVFSANALSPVTTPVATQNWWRMACDGTNITFQSSADGLTWAILHTEPLATYINAGGGTTDEVGFGSMVNGGNVLDTCQSFTLV